MTNVMPNLLKQYQRKMIVEKEPVYQMTLDNLPSNAKQDQITKILRKQKINFKNVEILPAKESVQFGQGSLSSHIMFEAKDDFIKAATFVVCRQAFKIGDNQLFMRVLRETANFSSETSVYIGSLNPQCTEQHIITELNQIFRYNKTYRKELQKWNQKKGARNSKKQLFEYFVLGCLVFADPESRDKNKFAFVDLDCAEAVQVVIKAWNQKSMSTFFNTLNVCQYTSQHQKETQEQRRLRSLSSKRDGKKLTNLYVESLPYCFDEQDVRELFSIYGDVNCVKVKKPLLNVSAEDVDKISSSAYVNFNSEEDALTAKNAINGKSLAQGCPSIFVDFYQKSNRFPGVHRGLDRQELAQNSHFRVLYLSGLYQQVTRRDLWTSCLKFGSVDVVTLKTKIEDNEEVSRCKAIVQFTTKEGAAEALRSLPFEKDLGSDELDVTFYKSKESRMIENLQRTEFLQFDRLMPVLQALSKSDDSASTLTPVTQSSDTLAPVPYDQFTAPKYVIRPFHLRLPKKGTQQEAEIIMPPKKSLRSRNKPSQREGRRADRRRSSSRRYQPRVTIQEDRHKGRDINRKQTTRGARRVSPKIKEQKVYQKKNQVDEEEKVREEEGEQVKVEEIKPKQRVKFDIESLRESLKLDLASVYSQRTKDLEEEERQQQQLAKAAPRSQSWRNMSITRKETHPDDEVRLENQRRPQKVFGARSARQASWTQRKNSASPKAEEKRKHSYSPRYLEFLHTTPNQSPKDNNHLSAEAVVKKKPIWGQTKEFQSPGAAREDRKRIFQTKQKPRMFASATKNPLKHNISQTFETQDIYTHMDQVNQDQAQPMNFGSPVKLLQAPPAGIQSPQPNLSPSSLINYLYAQEEEGFSAPQILNYKNSVASKEGSTTADKPPVTFGMFNWNWESSGEDNDKQDKSDNQCSKE